MACGKSFDVGAGRLAAASTRKVPSRLQQYAVQTTSFMLFHVSAVGTGNIVEKGMLL